MKKYPLPESALQKHRGFPVNKTPDLIKIRLLHFQKQWMVIKKIGDKWFVVFTADEMDKVINKYVKLRRLSAFKNIGD